MTVTGSLNAAQRAGDIARLAGEELDVLVIGGGITGAGVALDAATRGLRTGLVERRDLANGTSRWSSKLVHGGLRYLRHGQVAVAWESARERHILMTTTAPHLVHPLPFLAALNRSLSPLGGALTEAGVRAGDVLRLASGTRRRQLPGPRRVSALEARRLFGGLRRDGLRGAILFWDGQLEDDARLVIAVARSASANGAAIVTHCTALGASDGHVTLRDERSGATFEARARTVINATGVWADTIDESVRLRPSKGAHVIVDAHSLGDPRAALVVPVRGESARWVGATPTGDGRVIVGVTDDAHRGPIVDEAAVSDAEEEFLLRTLSDALERPLRGRRRGRPLRGLPSPPRHGRGVDGRPVAQPHHRRVARMARWSPSWGASSPPTGAWPRMPSTGWSTVTAARRAGPPACPWSAPGRAPSPTGVPERLVRRYGDEAGAVARLAAHDPALLEPVFAGSVVLGVELLFGVLHEGALDVDDLLDRRVRLGLVPAERRRAEDLAVQLLGGVAA